MSVVCLHCQEEIIGRIDKKFCTPYCKSAYHYQKNSENEDSLFKKIDKQLKKNRKILKSYNKAGQAKVRKEKLIQAGFDLGFFTHYWKNKKGQVYLFCYEYGFLELSDQHKKKYLLITWQSYMS
ncbi:hypothetical protein [Aquimarina sp. MMG016]|uniref:hypothetical protein n=1 Tax=Aquimarina sp. MMG016 TaxID=2822690 RepID=UPI001B3A7533|nr:hypothetical protein [Aquimarina sp. MMG016]MBQ4820266.1 hypothetical protein [Aquimarina sp. MMG016]